MVRVSTTAVALLEESRRSQGIPESHGVRVYGEENQQGGMDVRLAFTDDPEDGDHTVEEHGTEFFIAPEVVQPLEDSVIDVAGEDSQQLTLRQAEPGA